MSLRWATCCDIFLIVTLGSFGPFNDASSAGREARVEAKSDERGGGGGGKVNATNSSYSMAWVYR